MEEYHEKIYRNDDVIADIYVKSNFFKNLPTVFLYGALY